MSSLVRQSNIELTESEKIRQMRAERAKFREQREEEYQEYLVALAAKIGTTNNKVGFDAFRREQIAKRKYNSEVENEEGN